MAERQLRKGAKASLGRVRAMASSSLAAMESVSRSESLLMHMLTRDLISPGVCLVIAIAVAEAVACGGGGDGWREWEWVLLGFICLRRERAS